jgi:hypothetical protein
MDLYCRVQVEGRNVTAFNIPIDQEKNNLPLSQTEGNSQRRTNCIIPGVNKALLAEDSKFVELAQSNVLLRYIGSLYLSIIVTDAEHYNNFRNTWDIQHGQGTSEHFAVLKKYLADESHKVRNKLCLIISKNG